MTEETVCIGLARVSSETQKIVSGTLKELKDIGKFIILFHILSGFRVQHVSKIYTIELYIEWIPIDNFISFWDALDIIHENHPSKII